MPTPKKKVKPGLTSKSAAADVTTVQDYLERFGYLGTLDADSIGAPTFPLGEGDDQAGVAGRPSGAKKGKLDAATKEAIASFQRFANLPVTGTLDDATADKMNQPRCGIPDSPGLDEFTTSGRRWATNNLRYAFQNFTPDVPENDIVVAIEQAFALWAGHTPLRFSRVAMTAGPEIVIRFVGGDHGDGSPFDGASGVLAHAFYPSVPPTPPSAIMGDAHFDEAETWTVVVPPAAGRIDLVTVAAHEFGHSLGLGHSDVTGALMAPFYGGPYRLVAADDIAGIRSLYGNFAIEHASWVHGTDLQIELDSAVESVRRYGFFTRVVGKPNTTNWYHLPVPTPVITKGNRLSIARAMLRFVTGGPSAVVRDVHVYDGSSRIAAHQEVNLSGSQAFAVFGVPHKPDALWGNGISIGVRTGTGSAAARRIDVISGGIDYMA
jgi:hypothetical protein